MTLCPQIQFGYPSASLTEMQRKNGFSSSAVYSSQYRGYSQPNLSFFQNNKPTEPQKSFGDYLARTSLSVAMLLNLMLFASPQLAKLRWVQEKFIQPQLLKNNIANPSKPLAPVQALKHLIQKWLSLSYLFQLNTTWQVGMHTQQPNKLLTVATGAIREALMFRKVTPVLQSGSYLSNFLWYAGETNDIKNNNDIGQRREWDPRRLLHLFSGQGGNGGLSKPAITDKMKQGQDKLQNAGREMLSLLKYLAHDYIYVVSLKPWQGLLQSVKDRESLTTPQPYQTALGAQFNILAFAAQLLSIGQESRIKKNTPLLKDIPLANWNNAQALQEKLGSIAPEKLEELARLQKMPVYLQRSAKILGALGIAAYIPIVMRALQSKSEPESVLTFLGVPLVAGNQVMLASRNIETMKGLFALGAPMINEGKRLNSKKYRAQVNYLQFLYNTAQQNPQLTAADILRFWRTHPEELKGMKLYMGQNRVDYMIEKLQDAAIKQQSRRISLVEVLMPLMQGDQS
ncbi:MAG: hypothetical protein K0Q50_2290 [Vampirovibrio sp.]|nr:hypothetical protein [Vampirovibrio sp.]